MKKLFAISVILCVLLLISCNKTGDGVTVEPSPTISPVELSPTSSVEPSIEPSVEPSVEPMSYEEYFAEEREWNAIYTGYRTMGNTLYTDNSKEVLIADGIIDTFYTNGVVAFFTLEDGGLYRIYLLDGTTDLLANCETISSLSILSNHDVSWTVKSDQWDEICRRYESKEHFPDYLIGIFQFEHFDRYYYRNTLTNRYESRQEVVNEEFLLFLDEYGLDSEQWPEYGIDIPLADTYTYDLTSNTENVDTTDWYRAHYNYNN